MFCIDTYLKMTETEYLEALNKATKQTIEYNGKTIKMPFEIYPEFLNEQEVEAANHFSGESTTLPQFAKAVRDAILGQSY